MYCPKCGSTRLTLLKSKAPSGARRIQCKECNKRCNENTVLQTLDPDIHHKDKIRYLEQQIKILTKEKVELSQEALDTTRLKELIYGAKAAEVTIPNWVIRREVKPSSHGTPTLFLSDLHWGERVYPAEVNGVNEFNLPIARKRLERVFSQAVTLLTESLGHGNYEGFVLPLGGDMISGNIHEELRETNECHVLEALLDLLRHLIAGIELLRREFGRVYVPCVVGNHGRLDKKPRAKGAVRDNFEWLLYHMLASHYDKDSDIVVQVSESLDFRYRVHQTVYLLTHGDQFRGGSGISGPLTPWALGDHRKRKRQDAIQQPYDVLIFGHWHRLFWGDGSFIANGSLKGYDEYAFRNNFSYQAPMQALWVTHPNYGITFQMPVLAEKNLILEESEWVSIAS